MSNSISLVFENNSRIQSSESVKQFVDKQSSSFVDVFLNDEQLVVIKDSDAPTYEDIRMTAGSIARSLSKQNLPEAVLSGAALVNHYSNLEAEKVVTAFVEGWELGTYTFTEYKTKKEGFATKFILNGKEWDTYVTQGKIRASGVAFSRNLMNEIPSTLNPETFPEILSNEFSGTNVEVKVHNKAALEEMEMNGVLTVGRGSKYEPSFVELTYKGDYSKPLVALVGKGVTFDTGGISLKKGKDISSMRMDMGGAAAVSGAMKLLADSNANVNVVALIPIVENMPDKLSVLPGEVIHYKNGHTVQVGNTDAEGRLILADGLIRAGELGAEYIVDIATLTGAILNALGTKLAGVFGDEGLALQMKTLGDINGDYNWPMPLVDDYDNYLASDFADFSNTSSKAHAGSITASLFLRRFKPEDSKWLHVDMAGVMMGQEKGYYSKAATGFGARLLADFTELVSK
ncbi:leucyl aminopeptidase family protein [Ornithinibacillus halophilus]|uniref:Probable cytosol aminopeptidase n=1 Tax=Ornithinibacillus halophilus TaxID=930117 RepID=A0A1M5J6F4_9BACI|nr:leucyl aminopeptidase family protein [Ornithinibacillus halophilus]SHG35573.1 leucyl aminopeptidase [Ornithinibacillus halophilus]